MIHNHHNYDDERTDRTFRLFCGVLIIVPAVIAWGCLIIYLIFYKKWD